ncbi:MAG TPA: GntR family transcriptional regulator [Eoetvoesiella sp.]|uniref:GntR family transcriptional regulator n=1 Tax=Eoetvoesiella sp. TaxID=1966355 RepID=UPI002CD6D783|nr:GntR family transcriptional regulator [Eoetvoesiella sp.]HWK61855.1 GntR family transcriptional regulator [Eoetvoesiella sp.]
MSIDQLAESIPSQTLPTMVYNKVREAILNGVFGPGQMLRQDEVASKLGVSRSPLREALPRLEADGIVVLHPRRGYAVASLDPAQINEVFDLRCLLETELARRAIQKRTDADISAVYSIAAEMASLASCTDDKSLTRWFDLNMRFHTAMLSAADSPHHLRALDHSRTLIESYIRTETRLTGDLIEAQEEHAQLAQAFVVGDAEEFIRLTRSHSDHTRIRLLSRLPAIEKT